LKGNSLVLNKITWFYKHLGFFHLILIKNYHSASTQSEPKKVRQVDALIIAVVRVLYCKGYILRILLKILISKDLGVLSFAIL
jgi:hypothetical protein